MGIKKTHEQYVEELKIKKPNIILLDTYIGSSTKNKFKCLICGHEWIAEPSAVLTRTDCYECKKKAKQKTKEKFIEELKIEKPNAELISEYNGFDKTIRVRCKTHGCEFDYIAQSIFNKSKDLPCCKESNICVAGINDLTVKAPHLVKYFKNPEDAKKYKTNSKIKVELICPECHTEKSMVVSSLFYNGFSCNLCGDKKSYPEKLMSYILRELSVDYIHQAKFNWNKKRKYDFYIPEYNLIIETHGLQHYEGGMGAWKGLNQQEVDSEKRNSAKENGIKNYIEIDCRYSNIDFIKNNILNSELANIFDFNNVDWQNADEYIQKSLFKRICDLKNIGKCNADIIKELKTSNTQIYRAIKIGKQIGWI